MDFLERLKLKIKRGETPFYRRLRAFLKSLFRLNLPVPRLFYPLLRMLYEFHYFVIVVVRRAIIFFYKEPLFRSRCTSVGKRLTLYDMPFVMGHADIQIGDDVTITGHIMVVSGRFLDKPRLIIKDRAAVGGGTVISVNREVIIEEDAIVSTQCRISDNDGHPRAADLRAQYAPLDERDIRPVRICRHAWIGNGTQIMKGVTIGEGAIVGANSVVISDIPSYCLAMGNPAEVFMKNVGKPKQQTSTVSAGNV